MDATRGHLSRQPQSPAPYSDAFWGISTPTADDASRFDPFSSPPFAPSISISSLPVVQPRSSQPKKKQTHSLPAFRTSDSVVKASDPQSAGRQDASSAPCSPLPKSPLLPTSLAASFEAAIGRGGKVTLPHLPGLGPPPPPTRKTRPVRLRPVKRWRLFCFKNAFVIEPNIKSAGLRYRADLLARAEIEIPPRTGEEQKSGSNSPPDSPPPPPPPPFPTDSPFSSPAKSSSEFRTAKAPLSPIDQEFSDLLPLTPPHDETSALYSPNAAGLVQGQDINSSAKELPQLVVFRDSDVVVEVLSSTHQLYKSFGPLEQLFVIDALIGQVHIADARFLAVVAESELTAAMCRASFVDTTTVASSASRTPDFSPDMFVYRVQKAWLIPYHLPLSTLNFNFHEQPPSPPTDASPASAPSRGGDNGGVPDDLRISRTPRNLPNPRDSLGSFRSQAAKRSASQDSGMRGRRSHDAAPPSSYKDASGNRLPRVARIEGDWNGFGDAAFNSLLGERLATYKAGVEKLLISSFCYSYDLDITHTLQRQRIAKCRFLPQGWPCGLGKCMITVEASPDAPSEEALPGVSSMLAEYTLQPVEPGQGDASESLTSTQSLLKELFAPAAALDGGGFPSETLLPPTESRAAFMDTADPRFVWNASLCHPFFAWSIDPRWVTPLMQGSYMNSILTYGGLGLESVLISRRAAARSGTRYNHRGLDDEGNVANFNESEQMLSIYQTDKVTGAPLSRSPSGPNGGWASLVQIRGSVPLFWEQNATLASINPPPQLSRSLEFTWHAFQAHQKELTRLYGRVTYVNLLAGAKAEGKLKAALEAMLAELEKRGKSRCLSPPALDDNHRSTPDSTGIGTALGEPDSISRPSSLADDPRVRHIHWDFHQQIKQYGLENALTSFVTSLGYDTARFGYYCDQSREEGKPRFQMGVFRTNCLDCLDRTNVFQWFVSWYWLNHYLRQRETTAFMTPAIDVEERILDGSELEQRLTAPLKRDSNRRGLLQGGGAAASNRRGSRGRRLEELGGGAEGGLRGNSIRSSSSSTRRGPRISSALTQTPPGARMVVVSLGTRDGALESVYAVGEPSHVGDPAFAALVAADPATLLWQLGSEGMAEERFKFFPNVLKAVVARMWADHGDAISRAYTGTGSVLSGVVRQGKSSLSTNVGHVMTSLGRIYQNTFEDSSRQDAIEILLNTHERLSLPYIVGAKSKSKTSTSMTASLSPVASAPSLHSLPSPHRMHRHRDRPRHRGLKLQGPLSSELPTKISHHPPRKQTVGGGLDRHETALLDSLAAAPPPPPPPLPEAAVSVASPAASAGTVLPLAPETSTLKVWFGTWNLGGHRMNDGLERWLFCDDLEKRVSAGADVYVIAIQELVELTGMRVLLSQSDREKEWQLETNVRHALGPNYQLLRSQSLVGLYLGIFVRVALGHLISQVQASELKFGFKGQMGNKGALLLRMGIGGTSFCFVNVHLTPGLEKAQQRRTQLQAVLDASFQGREMSTVRSHDCVIIGGDFNFRCDVENGQAERWLDYGMWKELLNCDQFVTCRKLAVPPFHELQEAPISFLPTYKFRRGTNLFDRSRTPGWCDRVIFTGEYARSQLTREWIQCQSYSRAMELLSSDHKPVCAVFSVMVLHVVRPPPPPPPTSHPEMTSAPAPALQGSVTSEANRVARENAARMRRSRDKALATLDLLDSSSIAASNSNHDIHGDEADRHLSPQDEAPSKREGALGDKTKQNEAFTRRRSKSLSAATSLDEED